jgi:hypothetical protein
MINLSNKTLYLFIAWVLVISGPMALNSSSHDNSSRIFVDFFSVQSTSTTSPTPTHTSTPTPTPSITPTTTLEPLPAITLIFPASTSTSIPIITLKPTFVTQTPSPSRDIILANVSPRMKALVIVLFILWILLASFLVIYIHQFK